MHIFVDESGTFTAAPAIGSYCLVAAAVVPEPSYRQLKTLLTRLKTQNGFRASYEVKRKHISEQTYLQFLDDLAEIDFFCTAVATDAALNGDTEHHKEQQAQTIEAYAPNMHFEDGRLMVRQMAADVRSLSNQNYVELWCRTILVHELIQKATLFYAQRRPGTLSAFRWRFDQKSKLPNHFEATFSRLVGPLTQSMALSDPFITLEEADYSKFERFRWVGDEPEWLPLPEVSGRHSGLINVGMIWREDLQFVDSATCPGVQVADLLVSGIAGCLRGRFIDNERAATAIGRLLLRPARGKPAISLISLNRTQTVGELVADEVASVLNGMARVGRPMLA